MMMFLIEYTFSFSEQQPAGLLMFLESADEVPKGDAEEDRLNFRDNLNLAIQHSNKSKRHVIEKHLEDIKHWGLSLIDRQEKINQAIQNRPIVLRNRRVRKKITDKEINLPYFYYQFLRDHSLPNLIWNHKVSACHKTRSSRKSQFVFFQDERRAASVLGERIAPIQQR